MHITSNNNHTNIYIVDNIFRLNYNKKYIINYKLVECLKPAVQNTIVYLHVLINNVPFEIVLVRQWFPGYLD